MKSAKKSAESAIGARRASSKKTVAKKTVAKKTVAKKAVAKKTVAKKTVAKKAAKKKVAFRAGNALGNVLGNLPLVQMEFADVATPTAEFISNDTWSAFQKNQRLKRILEACVTAAGNTNFGQHSPGNKDVQLLVRRKDVPKQVNIDHQLFKTLRFSDTSEISVVAVAVLQQFSAAAKTLAKVFIDAGVEEKVWEK